ncbi:FG-GAP repeat protein [Actinomadura barringtoniae]|uniref:FG-GAP repeat protein n=1 Tax=Actinomadura barringtoniae TaxID=1427535 RepID=A0A939PBF0_9ACTN|nr:FG-GAP and VCBS repeat-containing protein [Actinomadura barringtoniae]MBO2449338.1 FG-GAP repeat protein [Actinomadura barringtoniae]
MRKRVLPRLVAGVAVTGCVGALGLTALAPAASAASPAKPYDFNGDGYRDLAIGSPNGKVSGKAGAGFVTVTYGSRGGLNTGKRQVLTQDTKGVPGAAEAGDHFGYAVTSADFNRDGRADLVVSSPDEDSSKKNVGSFTVFYGTKSGLSTHAYSSGVSGSSANERVGLSLTAGDFNHGGHADFAYSGTYGWGWFAYDPGARSARAVQHRLAVPGARSTALSPVTAMVYSGDILGLGYPQIVLAWRDPKSTQYRNDVSIWSAKNRDELTMKSNVSAEVGPIAVGDFNGDRRADVAIGQPGDGGHTGGRVTVFAGSVNGVHQWAQTSFSQNTAGIPGASTAGNRFGADLSVGDVNHDGKADLAVGAPGVKVGSAGGAGGAYLLFGRANGLTGTGAQWMSQDTAGVPGGAERGDAFGAQVALGDNNRDGRADLTIGAPGENRGDGSVTLIKGRASGVLPIAGAFAFGPGTFKVSGKGAQLGLRLGD